MNKYIYWVVVIQCPVYESIFSAFILFTPFLSFLFRWAMSSSADNSIWRLNYNNTSPFSKSWSLALISIYALIVAVSLIVSWVINRTYESCYNTYDTTYDAERCNATQLSIGQRLYSAKFAYSVMNPFNYTQQPLLCAPNMDDGTTLVFYTTPFLPQLKYNITVNCQDGLNMSLVDHTLWSMNLIVRDWTNTIRDNYRCTRQHTLCCTDTTNTTCSYDCSSSSDAEDIVALQIKNPQTTTFNIYSASHQCHTDLTQNMTSELASMIRDDIPSIDIQAPFQCRMCSNLDREGWALFWLMVVGCISIVSFGLRVITVIAKFIYVGRLEDSARQSTVLDDLEVARMQQQHRQPSSFAQQGSKNDDDYSSTTMLLKSS